MRGVSGIEAILMAPLQPDKARSLKPSGLRFPQSITHNKLWSLLSSAPDPRPTCACCMGVRFSRNQGCTQQPSSHLPALLFVLIVQQCMLGPIVAIQLLELTSISGFHESLWSFSILNEFTGPAGRSNEVADGTLATRAEACHWLTSAFLKKRARMGRGEQMIHEDAWHILHHHHICTDSIRFNLTENSYSVKLSSRRRREEQSVSSTSFTRHKRKETFPLTKEIKGSRRLPALLPCRPKWLLPELLD